MVKVRYKERSTPDKLSEKLKFIFKTRLFKVAITLSVIGVIMVIASFQVQGTYYYQNNASSNVVLNDNVPQVFNFSMLPGAPLNLTFEAPTGLSIHYAVYAVAYVIKNGQETILKTQITSGTAMNNTIKEMDASSIAEYYVMELTTNASSSFNATVSANQAIPKQIPSNFYLGVPGAIVMVTGFIAVSVSITRGFR